MKFYFKIFGLFLLLLFVSLGVNSVNQKKEVFAENETLTCNTKIPIGEATDHTSDLLNNIYVEMKNIYDIVPNQVSAVKKMIKAVNECNIENCQPVCVDISCYSSTLGDKEGICSPDYEAKCVEKECKGKICPDLGLVDNLIDDYYEKINSSFEEINNLYTKNIEKIDEEIKLSREEFNNCTQNETSKTVRCQNIFNEDYMFSAEKIKECELFCGENKKAEEMTSACLECLCSSSINYFCCD
jgi:hypothetical protein